MNDTPKQYANQKIWAQITVDELSDLRRQLAEAKAECERLMKSIADALRELSGIQNDESRYGTAATLAKLVYDHFSKAVRIETVIGETNETGGV
jgi:hypothetical protein